MADNTEETVKDDSQTTVESDTDATTETAQNEPETPETKGDKRPSLKEQPVEEQLAFWQSASRKHEKQAKDNYEKLRKVESDYTQVQNQLHDMQMENAFMKARAAHPGLTDEQIALCDKTTPDEVAEWADKVAKAFNLDTATTGSTGQSAHPVRDKAEKGARTRGEGRPTIASGSYEDGKRKAEEFAKKRRQAASGDTK